ncbi:hypothetical protein POTOM_025120 [Populus tomentosa]|uniref:Telomere repeat-binding protein 1-6-like ubiquitin-like domain-containing protein n=1 Tax=Populus tomentosa TaxID=118781 RepID=A0A8X7ZI22_POPTO|nr:hypothetical protein POTOM_025120 [Populus tomentosa]
MVFQRRLDYGFDGYQVPVVPRASRSVRVIKCYHSKVARCGEILQEEETSAPTNTACGKDLCNVKNTIQQEQVDRGKFLIMEPLLGEPCNEKAFACILELQGHWHGNALNKFLHNEESFNSQGSFALERFDYPETIYVVEKLVVVNSKNAGGSSSCEMNGESSHARKIFKGKVEDLIERKPEAELVKSSSIESGTLFVKDGSEDAMDLDASSIGHASVKSNVKASSFKDCTGPCPFSRPCADVEVVSGDDDGNPSGCSQYGAMPKTSKRLLYTETRRMSNLTASRHWRVAPNSKSGGYFRTATEASSSVTGQHASLDSRDCNVKLSIKSFKVPELFIEIPATATVGSLKRTVMEAITAILGDGLHVGIFSKERRHAKMMLPPHTKNPSNLPFSAPGGITRHTTSLMLQAGTSHASSVPAETNFSSSVGSDLGAVCSLAKASTADKMSDSRALVPVPAIGRGELSAVPFNCKSMHSEFGQRRIRRPFTVADVEALVQAVERIGTGRWRDVKLHAFDKANHQTYVDLKVSDSLLYAL